MKVGYMAVGSYGTTHHLHNPEKPPRAQLLEKCHRKHCDKIYRDDKDGKADHVGYIIGGEWFTIYEVHKWSGNK